MEQSYGGGKWFRPQPLLHFSENPCLLVIATPWGERKIAQNLMEELVSYMGQVSEDEDKTTLHKKLPFLTSMENHLRSAFLHVSDLLFQENAKADVPTGVELLLIFFHKKTLYWVQQGAPHFFLYVRGKQKSFLQPFLSVSDWSHCLSPHRATKAPLPRYMLGLHAYNDFKVGSLSMGPVNPAKDGLVFLTSPYICPAFYACSDFFSEFSNLGPVVQLLSKENGNYPFWLGAFPFKALPPETF